MRGTDLQHGSVYGVLNKDNSEYIKDEFGKWKLRDSASDTVNNNGSITIGQ